MTDWWWIRHGPTHSKSMVGWSDIKADLSDHETIKKLNEYLPQSADLVSSDLSRTIVFLMNLILGNLISETGMENIGKKSLN